MLLSDEDVQRIKQEYAASGLAASDEFVRHFHDYTQEELKDFELYIQQELGKAVLIKAEEETKRIINNFHNYE